LSKSKWRLVFNLLKVCLTALILWGVFARIDLKALWTGIAALPLWLLPALVLLSLIRHWGQFINWCYSLQINPKYIPDRKEQLVSYLIGLPLRFAVPGGSASAGKVFFVSNSSRWASLFSFAMERAFLTWSTWTYAFAAALIYYRNFPLWLRLGLLILTLTAPLWGYWLLGTSPKTRWLKPGYARYAPRISAIQTGIAALSYVQYWLILNQIHPISFWESTLRMSLTQFSNSIPFTVGGLGLREGFAIHFLAGAGFDASQAVTATLTLFAVQDLLFALPGLLLLMFNKSRRSDYAHAGN